MLEITPAATDVIPTHWHAGPRARDFRWVVAAGLAFYALNVDFLLNGDAAMYADYVLNAKFDELTLHIGYYAVAFALHHSLGALLGLPIHETLVWLNVAAGALTLGVTYRLAFHLLGTRRDALLAAVMLAVCGRMYNNATSSEVYMLQTCLVMSSWLLFVENRAVTAGLAAGAALLVSPLSAFAYLFFPVYELLRPGKIRWRVLLRVAAAALVLYLPYLVVHGSELLWGRRGLLGVSRLWPADPWAMVVYTPYYQFKHYTVLLLLLIPALLGVRRHMRLLAVTLSVALPHLYIALKITSQDQVFLLNTDFFFACWLVVGWQVLARTHTGRAFAVLLLAGHLALLIGSRQFFALEPHREYASEMRGIAQRYLVGRDATVIADWSAGMVLTYFGRQHVAGTIEQDPLFRQVYDITATPRPNPRLLDARELYVLDTWQPGPLNRLLSPSARLAQLARDHSIVAAATRLGLDCSPIQRLEYPPLYRCERPAVGTGPARDHELDAE